MLKLSEYIKKMLLLSFVLTVILNIILIGLRFFPFEIFTEWVLRLEVGNTVVIIPWFAMVVLSILFTLLQYVFRGKNNQ